MQGFWTILMLVCSNIFMTFAWYGHLKLQEMKISTGWPLILIILFKVIQEVISLTVFTIIVHFLFQGQSLQWNHLAAFVCLILAVFFVFLK